MSKKKEVKLITQRQFELLPQHMEDYTGCVSETVPNDAYSIKDILEKFTRGMDPGVTRQPGGDSGVSFDSPDLEKLRNADLYEKEEFATHLGSEMLSQKSILDKAAADNAAKEAAKLKEDEEMKAEFKRQRAEKAKAGKEGKEDK